MPAITTAFKPNLSLDLEGIVRHVTWLIDQGCHGIVVNGTLGEATSLSFEEKIQVLEICLRAIADRAVVIAGIGALTTGEAVTLAQKAAAVGCHGLMVLPPYQYSTDWYEMKAHVAAVIHATDLPCMVYNDPATYGTDFLPEHIAELAAEHPNLTAVKEATTDVRRITAIRSMLGKRLCIAVGMDDVLLEGIAAGATAWVSGTANAFPQESVALFHYAIQNEHEQAFKLYTWMLPLMRLNAVPKFVQMTKLMQQVIGRGKITVRPPRLELTSAERQTALNLIKHLLSERPSF